MQSSLRAAGILSGFLLLAPARADEGLSRQDVAKLAKPATGLVETKAGTGSGFCVHPSGYFVTNEHVVADLPEGGTVTLILDAGLKAQQLLKARVVRRDKELDLALLRAEGPERFAALALGSDDGLTELTELIAVGFPFGTALAKPGEYPTVTVSAGNVSSLRRDSKRDLHRIQFDSVLNPGNSGGPVLDRSGKVVGVVVTGIRGAGITMAIPVSHVRRFLSGPELALTSPAVNPEDRHAPVVFRATAVALTGAAVPLELELILANDGEAERRFEMKADGGTYAVKAVAFPPAQDGAVLRLEVKYRDGSVSGAAGDHRFTAGKVAVRLSEVRQIRPGATAEVLLNSGKKLEGPLAGLDSVTVKVGGNELRLNLAAAVEVGVLPVKQPDSVACTLVARQAGKEVGRRTVLVSAGGTGLAALESIRDGIFNRPRRASGPTSYLKVVSSTGDFIGRGESYSYDGSQLVVRGNARGLTITADGWTVEFAPPRGQGLKVGEYPNAKRSPLADAPGLIFHGKGRGGNRIAGKFVVWELEFKGDEVVKLAVDFVQNCEETMPPLCGMLRYHSSLE